MTDVLRVWDRQPVDTDKSYAAFSEFLKMPVYGVEDEKRTLKNLAAKLGYASPKQVGEWSAAMNWTERVAAYDAYMGSKQITLREASLEQFKLGHLSRVTHQLAMVSEMVERRMKILNDALLADVPVDTQDIKRLVASVDQIDIIARRSVGMPTSFTGVAGEEPELENGTFIIGAKYN